MKPIIKNLILSIASGSYKVHITRDTRNTLKREKNEKRKVGEIDILTSILIAMDYFSEIRKVLLTKKITNAYVNFFLFTR